LACLEHAGSGLGAELSPAVTRGQLGFCGHRRLTAHGPGMGERIAGPLNDLEVVP
jgi:hypothetical protein